MAGQWDSWDTGLDARIYLAPRWELLAGVGHFGLAAGSLCDKGLSAGVCFADWISAVGLVIGGLTSPPPHCDLEPSLEWEWLQEMHPLASDVLRVIDCDARKQVNLPDVYSGLSVHVSREMYEREIVSGPREGEAEAPGQEGQREGASVSMALILQRTHLRSEGLIFGLARHPGQRPHLKCGALMSFLLCSHWR